MAYFPGGFKAMKAADVFANLNDGDTSNDPVILDTRSAEDYALGHLPGAVNVSPKTMFTTENLAKLPADKQIVSYCYSGQTASQVTGALRMLGYDAYNMQFGMPSWAIVPGVSVGVWDVSKSLNQPLVLGTEATAAAARPRCDAAAPAPPRCPPPARRCSAWSWPAWAWSSAGAALRSANPGPADANLSLWNVTRGPACRTPTSHMYSDGAGGTPCPAHPGIGRGRLRCWAC